jgi:uncharacterized protein (UPF0332 family)
MGASEIQLYLERARHDLRATQINLEQGFYGVAVTRAYYAMFYAASALLASKEISRSKHSGVHSAFGEHFVKAGLEEVLRDARRFVDRAEQYLRRAGVL